MSTVSTLVTFKYLEVAPIGGRGGVQRFFMLANDIPFVEELFHLSEKWPTEKARLVETGENPCGTLPVSEVNGRKDMSQHIATSRYLAAVYKVNSDDAYKNYVQDLVADEYQGWRDAWATALFATEDRVKETYKTETLIRQLVKFEALFGKYKTADPVPYLSTNASGKPLWGDAAIFGVVYDNIHTGFMTEKDLDAYPNLKALYEAFGAISAVAEWISQAQK